MMEKIEWYQEVLEIEPSSKVFFPLAKLLASNNKVQKSITVLRQGLERHPEFLEARLMLIDLLQREGDVSGAVHEVKELGFKLTAYPGFWDAWAGTLSASDGDKDLAAALRLIAVFLRCNDLSWSDIINQGLASLIGFPPAAKSSPTEAPPCSHESVETEELTPPVEESFQEQDRPASMPPESVTPEASAEFSVEDEEGDEERFSLRTKAMAAVLAEQGDYGGAREIYAEILTTATNPDTRSDLEERIADLAAKIKFGHVAVASGDPENLADQGKNKLIQVLERLAGRLESRADKV